MTEDGMSGITEEGLTTKKNWIQGWGKERGVLEVYYQASYIVDDGA